MKIGRRSDKRLRTRIFLNREIEAGERIAACLALPGYVMPFLRMVRLYGKRR